MEIVISIIIGIVLLKNIPKFISIGSTIVSSGLEITETIVNDVKKDLESPKEESK